MWWAKRGGRVCCSAKMQYLLTCKVSRYCILASAKVEGYAAPQSQKAVSEYLKRKQIRPFGFCKGGWVCCSAKPKAISDYLQSKQILHFGNAEHHPIKHDALTSFALASVHRLRR